ncbi:MAG: family 10 glycosylhydrolase, partial [Burkholderiales bacterium]|nr:family 10 glycosylhydrolase [Burkholderiales bacterium]
DATRAPPGGAAEAGSAPGPGGAEPPPVAREYRGAWVATVANIDWPSRPGLPAAVQQAQALAILDRAAAIGLNALVLQVRPAGDALYASALEPWSEYLTGAQGRAPEPAYDPLAFWVEQAHRRGLQLEAWFNPFRARAASARTPLAAPHLAVQQPGLAKRYGDQLWFDPGAPEAAARVLAVVADVVRRYDIDGVQIDDYFYPYPVAADGVDLPFPDDDSYDRYRAGGGLLARDDWRRANVDGLVESLSRTVHATKPWVRFGVSPFGLGRPDRRPAGVAGFSQYDKLYADVERWLAQGWVDDLSPQLYWRQGSEGQPFGTLLAYWLQANTAGRAIWPSLFTSKAGREWPAQELLDQIAQLRATAASPPAGLAQAPAPAAAPSSASLAAAAASGAPVAPAASAGAAASPASPAPPVGASGEIHFSMAALMDDRGGLATKLQQGPYAQPALVPAMPWLRVPAPPAPQLQRAGAQWRLGVPPAADIARWVVWRRAGTPGASWRLALLPGGQRIIEAGGDRWLRVQAVGRTGRLGAPAAVEWP